MNTYKPRVVLPLHTKSQSKATASDSKGALLRSDGRSASQLRPIYAKTGAVTQAAGSAYVEINNTKVVCAIYGPRQSTKYEYSELGKLMCDFTYAPFALDVRRKRGQDPDERELSLMLSEALEVSVQLEKYPKSVIEAYVTVLEDGGGVVGAAIMCASLALADAAIEMYDLVASAQVIQRGDVMWLDPDGTEESGAWDSAATVAYMPSLKQITHIGLQGNLAEQRMHELIELGTDACGKVYGVMRQCLIKAASKPSSALL